MTRTRNRWIRVAEAMAITLAVGLWMVLAGRTIRSAQPTAEAAWLVLAGCGGYLVADLVSGLAHWFCDTFFEEHTPLIGPLVIQPFREHHRDPLAMTRHGLLERNGNTCAALLPSLGLAVALTAHDPSTLLGRLALSFITCLLAGLAVTNQLHSWAHDPTPPALARWLHACGWILSPERHARHHRAPYSQAYCVTHGWLNPLLDGTRFFENAATLGEWLRLPRTRRP